MAARTAGNASFTAAFSVDQTPEEAFDAINTSAAGGPRTSRVAPCAP